MRVRHENAGPEKELRLLRYQIPIQDFMLTVIVKDIEYFRFACLIRTFSGIRELIYE
jgi:hypothetical protein